MFLVRLRIVICIKCTFFVNPALESSSGIFVQMINSIDSDSSNGIHLPARREARIPSDRLKHVCCLSSLSIRQVQHLVFLRCSSSLSS